MTLPIEIIAASAGSGKTYRLAEILREALVAGEARPEKVVAVTFTIKAAAELEERARRFLIENDRAEDAHRLAAARIGTVHGVCSNLIADFALELGLSPELSVLDEASSAAALKAAFSRVVSAERQERLADLRSRMRDWDWEVLRGEVLTWARDNAVDADGLRASRDRSLESFLDLLDPPFEDVAAFERGVVEALRTFLAKAPSTDVTQKTEGAREQAHRVVYWLENGSLISWDDWARLAGFEAGASSRAWANAVAEASRAYPRHPQLRADLEEAIRLVFDISAEALEAYALYKRERGAVDFPDQLALALQLLRLEPVREQLAGDLDLVLVDEFQDSSPIQLAVFIELAKLAKRSVWVGDQKQAIYGFLGADPMLMDSAIEAILGGEEPETLHKSWRSRPELVTLTSDLFAPAFARVGIPPERTRLEPAHLDEPVDLGPVIERWKLATRNAETDAQGIATGVLELLAGSATRVRDETAADGSRPAKPSDIAVLCRTNDHCLRTAAALAALGIPTVLARPGLLATPEAELVLSGMARWADPRDTLAAAVIARLAVHAAAGDDWLREALAEPWSAGFAETEPVRRLDAARGDHPTAGVIEAFDRIVDALAARDLASAWGESEQRLANLEALRALATLYVGDRGTEGASTTPAGFIDWVRTRAEQHGDGQAALTGGDAVVVSTWHGAKGLEWPITVLFDLKPWKADWALGVRVEPRDSFGFEDPLAERWIRYWPNPYGRRRTRTFLHQRVAEHAVTARMTTAQAREELRLVYVAWTRARDRVVLVSRDRDSLPKLLPVLQGPEGLLIDEPHGPVAKWVGHETALTIREIQPATAPEIEAAGGTVYAADGPRIHPPATIQPSTVEAPGTAGEEVRLGERLNIRGEPDWRIVGELFHGFFAADRPDMPPFERLDVARGLIERWGLEGFVRPEALMTAGDRLAEWAATAWPTATWRREWPLLHRLDDGSVVHGTADLVLETSQEFVLIDHKTFPGGAERAREESAGYAGQLRTYAEAVAAATGKTLVGAFIHLPVSGMVIEVSWD